MGYVTCGSTFRAVARGHLSEGFGDSVRMVRARRIPRRQSESLGQSGSEGLFVEGGQRLPFGFVVGRPLGDEKAGQQAQHLIRRRINQATMVVVRVEYRPDLASQPGRHGVHTTGSLLGCQKTVRHLQISGECLSQDSTHQRIGFGGAYRLAVLDRPDNGTLLRQTLSRFFLNRQWWQGYFDLSEIFTVYVVLTRRSSSNPGDRITAHGRREEESEEVRISLVEIDSQPDEIGSERKRAATFNINSTSSHDIRTPIRPYNKDVSVSQQKSIQFYIVKFTVLQIIKGKSFPRDVRNTKHRRGGGRGIAPATRAIPRCNEALTDSDARVLRATAYKIIVPSIHYLGSHRSTPPGYASS